jgi:microcin C transport system permease protein
MTPMLRLNPINRQRLQRFKQIKRAYVSFWCLLGLYVLGLFAELICNANPYYVRHEGKSYFPILASYNDHIPFLTSYLGLYPEDTFLHNGIATPPDYKWLNRQPTFADHPDNYMIFPPIPFGPNEIIAIASLDVPKDITVIFTPHARVSSLDLRPDLSIQRATNFTAFSAVESDQALQGESLEAFWPISPALRSAIEQRFANEPAAAFAGQLQSRTGQTAQVSMRAYTPRRRAPNKVRLRFTERPPAAATGGQLILTADQRVRRNTFAPWTTLTDVERDTVERLAEARLQRVVEDQILTLGAHTFRVRFDKVDIRYPFRPVAGHVMGIDNAGRDVLVRILYALRISLNFGFILVAVTFAIGIIVGAWQGYFGGFVDIGTQRFIEIWSALPFLYVIILLGSVFGRSFTLLLCIYGIFNWIGISYYMRAEFLKLRQATFVEAAKCLGVATRKVIFRHILPNATVPIITFFPFSLVGAIGVLSALDYLGFGLPPPTPSWGELLSQAHIHTEAWYLILYPFVALFVVILLGVFIGEGMRSAFDPKSMIRLE